MFTGIVEEVGRIHAIDKRPECVRLVTEGTVVHDMVYRPHRTRLLRDAQRSGAVTVPGVEMFLAQAAAQVRLFTGKELTTQKLRSFLAGSFAGGQS